MADASSPTLARFEVARFSSGRGASVGDQPFEWRRARCARRAAGREPAEEMPREMSAESNCRNTNESRPSDRDGIGVPSYGPSDSLPWGLSDRLFCTGPHRQLNLKFVGETTCQRRNCATSKLAHRDIVIHLITTSESQGAIANSALRWRACWSAQTFRCGRPAVWAAQLRPGCLVKERFL